MLRLTAVLSVSPPPPSGRRRHRAPGSREHRPWSAPVAPADPRPVSAEPCRHIRRGGTAACGPAGAGRPGAPHHDDLCAPRSMGCAWR